MEIKYFGDILTRKRKASLAMKVDKGSPYLPRNKIKNYFSTFKTSVAYRVWKRKLFQYGGIDENTNFKLLEVGCGAGYLLRSTERWFPKAEIFGLDLDKSLVDFATKHIKRARVILHDGHIVPFPDNEFDVICLLQVIEHLEDPLLFFAEANRALKPKGLLIIATPNPVGIPAKLLKDKWQGYRYDHVSLRAPLQWRKVIGDSGFKILEDGTTGLTGFKILQRLPFALINWIPMAIWGFFPWYKGESYMGIAKKI